MLKKKARRSSTPSKAAKKSPEKDKADHDESPLVSDDDGIDINFTDPQSKNEMAFPEMSVERLSDSDDDDDDGDANVSKSPAAKNSADVDAGEDSDSSSDGDVNPVGNIPMRWYEGFDHIGYDRSGQKIERRNKPTALDLAADPHAWRKIYDEKNDRVLELTDAELKAIARLRSGRHPLGGRIEDVEDEVIPWTTHEVEQFPMPSGTEPKSRFLPSRHEARLVVRLVRAIREGKLKAPKSNEDDDDDRKAYDIWKEHEPKTREDMTKAERIRNMMKVSAPKPTPPTHAESYNPPSEYLPSKDEILEWNEIEPTSRGTRYLPAKYDSLRHVPRYDDFIRERFERCLDLYLAVRVKVDPEKMAQTADDLVPELPKPRDLRPFPTEKVATLQSNAVEQRAKTIDVHPSGMWLISGTEDGFVKILDSSTGYTCATWDMKKVCEADGEGKETDRFPVNKVEWCPREDSVVFAAVFAKSLIVINAAETLGVNSEGSDQVLLHYKGATSDLNNEKDEKEEKMKQNLLEAGIEWEYRSALDENQADDEEESPYRDEMIVVKHPRSLRTLCWHRKGDYIACVGREGNSGTVAVHRLTRRATQIPFKKCALVQDVKFHPTRPFFIIATMHHVRIYNLAAQELVKTLRMSGTSWISSVDVHQASGDHVLVTSYDRRICWFDLDLSTRPYKTIRGHSKAVRVGRYHKRLPLFADGADDGEVHIFHGGVYDDLSKNALIVPVKKLVNSSKVVNALGVLDIVWHPRLPVLFTCGADGNVSMYGDCSQSSI